MNVDCGREEGNKQQTTLRPLCLMGNSSNALNDIIITNKSATLYSHITYRPLSRAWPRISRGSTIWPRNNTYAGRAAIRRTSNYSQPNTVIAGSSSSSHLGSAPSFRKCTTPTDRHFSNDAQAILRPHEFDVLLRSEQAEKKPDENVKGFAGATKLTVLRSKLLSGDEERVFRKTLPGGRAQMEKATVPRPHSEPRTFAARESHTQELAKSPGARAQPDSTRDVKVGVRYEPAQGLDNSKGTQNTQSAKRTGSFMSDKDETCRKTEVTPEVTRPRTMAMPQFRHLTIEEASSKGTAFDTSRTEPGDRERAIETKIRDDAENSKSQENTGTMVRKVNSGKPADRSELMDNWIPGPGTEDIAPPSKSWTQFTDDDLTIKLSNKIAILGFTTHAKFLLHSLSIPGRPPLEWYTHNPRDSSLWGEANRTLTMLDHYARPMSSTPVERPISINELNKYGKGADQQSPNILDNLIVDTAPETVVPSLRLLRHCIDRRTTVCLMQPGLGIMEALNQTVFTDPATRPNYIIGHSSHSVAHHNNKFWIHHRAKNSNHILLHGVPKAQGSTLEDDYLCYEGSRQTQNFVELMSAAPELNVHGVTWLRLVRSKMPSMVFSCGADAISVMLGVRYGEIMPNRYAKDMWRNLTEETIAIASKLPELQVRGMEHVPRGLESGLFWRQLRLHIFSVRDNTSRWVANVRTGAKAPVEFFNGYFIRRARELGLDHKYNSMAMNAVNARLAVRRTELMRQIPMRGTYMVDNDLTETDDVSFRDDDRLDLGPTIY
ncbi:hypothetical protein GGS20DRAFT_588301 [Poronia punctata]|nr:hypothetical protein GGS20DRAFT_588301 [Poronia punctata]